MRARVAIIAGIVALAALAPTAPASARDLARLIAPRTICEDQSSSAVSAATQEEAMRCMVNYARERDGLSGLDDSPSLDRSAADKSSDILRCDSFSHEACGREFTYWMQHVGYLESGCWRAGENIAWAPADRASVRMIFEAWIHSTGHRENILGPYRQLGVGLQVGSLEGRSEVHVWTQHFGAHC